MPADITMSALSTQQVQVPVQAFVQGLPYDPTGDTVQMAFMPSSVAPGSSDWKTGSWSTTAQGIFLSQCLVGPAGVTSLAPGTYQVWVKVTDNPEIPVMNTGSLQIF